jgi:malonyl-CoA O-methyltransferase
VILDAGCGTGEAIPRLRGRYPKAMLVGLDIANDMLLRARACRANAHWLMQLAGLAGLRQGPGVFTPLCADIERLPLCDESVDLVWSSLALQWVEDLAVTFRQVHRVLRPDGLFLFSSFGPDTLKELRASFLGIDGYSHVNQFMDMHDIGDLLMRSGFRNPVVEMEYLTLTYVELRDLLKELKAIGAQSVTGSRRQGLMGRDQWRQFEAAYERYRRDGRLPATYEIIYGHAWAGTKDKLEDGRQVIRRMPAFAYRGR